MLGRLLAATLLLTSLAGCVAGLERDVKELTFEIDCADEDGTASPKNMPEGRIRISLVGWCQYSYDRVLSADEEDGRICYVSFADVGWDGCRPNMISEAGCGQGVRIDDACILRVGEVNHLGGQVTGRYIDAPGGYYNNVGFFQVTATWLHG